MEAHVISIKDRSWTDIEQSLAQLSLTDPQLAISDDILTQLKLLSNPYFPSEIHSLIADYAPSVGPLDSKRTEIMHLRIYALFECGRTRSSLYCVSCLHYGAAEKSFIWLNKLALDLYCHGHFADAYKCWICAHRQSSGEFIIGDDLVLALAQTGHFAEALVVSNRMQHGTWTLLARGHAFAGLHMFDEALEALTGCIKHSMCLYVTVQAIELKNAIVQRTADAKKSTEIETLPWLREVHRIAASKQQYDEYLAESNRQFSIPDSVTYLCARKTKTKTKRKAAEMSSKMTLRPRRKQQTE